MIASILAATLAIGAPTAGQYPYPGQTKPARVRVLNAIVDQELLCIHVGDSNYLNLPYGQRTDYMDVGGPRALTMVTSAFGERLSNEVAIQVQPGYPHTVIFTGFVGPTGRFTPVVLRDTTAGKPVMSTTQFMFVNAMSDSSAVTIKMDGKGLNRFPILAFGKETPFYGYNPKEYEVTVESAGDSKELYSTKFRAIPGTRYTGVVMGAVGQPGNRGPRLFFYSF